MGLTGTILLCLILAYSDVTKGENFSTRTEKRGLNEGNASLDKRTPANGPLAQSPGIEYADTRPIESDKSPTQQLYSTSGPQPAKPSDVVSGQHGPVAAAIAAQLHSQIPIYQSRFPIPTMYEISQPVPSQLAYSEHNMYLQAQQNPVQYYSQQQANQNQHQRPLLRLAIRYPQQAYPEQPQQHQQPQLPQHPLIVPQQLVYQQGHNLQQLQRVAHFNQIPQASYNERPVEYVRSQVQPQVFVQQSPAGIEYAQKTEQTEAPRYAVQSAPKEVRIAPAKTLDKQAQNTQSGAVSYVSFTQSPVTPKPGSTLKPLNTKLEALAPTPNSIPQVQKPGPPPLVLVRVPNPRYFPQPQFAQPAQIPQIHHQQPQQYYQPQGLILRNAPYLPQQPLAIAPTFPPIQYFGKFAPEIFGPLQH